MNTLAREMREVCGSTVTVIRALGVALEYVYSPGEGYFAMECTFFQTRIAREAERGEEDDHRLEWIDSDAAIAQMSHRSQAWPVSEARRS